MILVAAEAVVANDAVVGVNVILVAALAVVANELEIALFAQLPVPVNEPTNEPVNEPVNGAVRELNCVELDIIPDGTPVSPEYGAVLAKEAVVVNDALTLILELCAQLLVPTNPTALEIELVYDDADTFP